jgi:hypothetical protein
MEEKKTNKRLDIIHSVNMEINRFRKIIDKAYNESKGADYHTVYSEFAQLKRASLDLRKELLAITKFSPWE